MGQTKEIFPKARKIYKKIFKSTLILKLTHIVIDFLVNLWAMAKGFSFPKKFNWEWKLEMLSYQYERDSVELFKKIIKPGMVVVDIGAHVGYYTTFFAKLVGKTGKVYAFEADLDNYLLLKKNVSKYKNVEIHNVAVSDKVGAIDFFKIINNTSCHSVVYSSNADKISVSAITLDSFCKENNINKIDVIKIDIEGGEYLAFLGMREILSKYSNISIITEFNPSAISSSDITPELFLQQLNGLGFSIFQILSNGQTKIIKPNEFTSLNLYYTGFTNLFLKK